MSAIFPSLTLDPIRLRAVDDSFGNEITAPPTFTIAAAGYSESIGGGPGMVLNLKITNVHETDNSDAAGEVLIETSDDQNFETSPIVTEEYGHVPFAEIPPVTSVTVRTLVAPGQHIRVQNTADVPVEVSAWYTPNR